MYINHITLVLQKRLRFETFVLSESVRARGRNPLPPAWFAPSFFLFSFAKYAAINSDWRTRGALRGSRFKESRNVLAPSARKSQSELAIYGAGYVRRMSRNSLSKFTQIRSTPAICSSIWHRSRAFLYWSLFSPPTDDNSKRTILLRATNYISNHRDSSNGIAE